MRVIKAEFRVLDEACTVSYIPTYSKGNVSKLWVLRFSAKSNTSHGIEMLSARYYASHTMTMLPTMKSVPRSRRQSETHEDLLTTVKRRKVRWYGHLPFIRSGQNHLTRHRERWKKTRQTEKMGRQHQGIDRPGVRQILDGSGEQRKMEESGCDIICGAPTTLAVKGSVKKLC